MLTIEGVIRPGNAPDPIKDIDVLVGMALTGGRERTEAEFRMLYEKAGLQLTRVIPTPSTLSIVEGVGVTGTTPCSSPAAMGCKAHFPCGAGTSKSWSFAEAFLYDSHTPV